MSRRGGRYAALAGLLALAAPACSSTVGSSAVPTDPPAAVAATPALTPPSTARRPTSTRPTVATTVTTTVTTTTVDPLAPRRITVAFSGDTLPHSPLWRQASDNAEAAGVEGYDFTPMLAGLGSLLGEVDLAVCHLETPIAPLGEELSTSPYYGVPAEIVDAIAAAGYDRCSTASNHAADRGAAGIDRTVEVLEASGLAQSGMARTPAEILPKVFDVGGVTISHLSYTWSYNGVPVPDGEEWRSALIDPERIVADATAARDLGAEVVIVSMHWGAEGVHAPTRFQREVADEITADGLIDLVVGHHAHVVQPIERVNDTWVLYGLGNILSNLPTSRRWPEATQDAAVVTVGFEVDADGHVAVNTPSVYPTWVDKEAGWVVRLVRDELVRGDISAGQRGRLERSLERTAAILGDFVDPIGPVVTSG